MTGHDIEHRKQRPAVVRRDEHHRCLALDPLVPGLGLTRNHEEPCVVFAVIGNVAAQHVQAVQRRGFGTRDRRMRRVMLLLDALDAHRRVDERLDDGLRERGEKGRALREGLRMRVDLAQGVERDVGDADQAHFDAEDLLADDRQVGVRERVVGVVDRSRCRVLDRQH